MQVLAGHTVQSIHKVVLHATTFLHQQQQHASASIISSLEAKGAIIQSTLSDDVGNTANSYCSTVTSGAYSNSVFHLSDGTERSFLRVQIRSTFFNSYVNSFAKTRHCNRYVDTSVGFLSYRMSSDIHVI